MPTTLPWRDDATGAARPADLEPLPPARMAVLRGGRPLKRWRYVGVYGPELMLCAGAVRIGGIPQAFWAVWDRDARALHERTRLRPRRRGAARRRGAGRARATPRSCWWSSPPGTRSRSSAATARSASGRASCPVRAHGSVTLDGRTRARSTRPGLVDDSAGYHARETAWDWSAGVGTSAAGEPVAWNLVDRRARRAARQRAHRLGRRRAARGRRRSRSRADLDAASATCASPPRPSARATTTSVVFASDYRQPFGTFSGTLPGGLELAEGFGVMERHSRALVATPPGQRRCSRRGQRSGRGPRHARLRAHAVRWPCGRRRAGARRHGRAGPGELFSDGRRLVGVPGAHRREWATARPHVHALVRTARHRGRRRRVVGGPAAPRLPSSEPPPAELGRCERALRADGRPCVDGRQRPAAQRPREAPRRWS